MKQLPIRIRLTYWYFVMFAAAALLLSTANWWVLRRTMDATIHQDLQERAGDVSKQIHRLGPDASVPVIQSQFDSVYLYRDEGKWLQIVRQDGVVLYRSAHMASLNPMLGSPALWPSHQAIFDVSPRAHRLRILRSAIRVDNIVYFVDTGIYMDKPDALLTGFGLRLLLLAPLVLLLAAAGGHLMSRKALAPVALIAHEARRITDKNLDNACKYTPAGGKVTLRMIIREREISLEVEDTGIGIAPEHQREIFNRFYRVHGDTGQQIAGAGLGLSLAAWIAAQHGAQISLDSTFGHGSRFHLNLKKIAADSTTVELNKPPTETNSRYVTFNKSLSELVSKLLKRLCTYPEFCQIEVVTHGAWCQKYLRFRTGSAMSWIDATRDKVWRNVVAKHLPRLHQAKLCMNVFSKESITTKDPDVMFLSEEIDFIYGKFLHSETPAYATVERRGRGRPLGPVQRSLVLSIYNELVDGLAKEKHFDAREMPRAAAVMLLKGEAPEHNYTDILVDEVQDLSDMELRVLHAIEQLSGQLFLVGDGAQQIYRRGQSLRSIGINVSGRGFILRKNYRNTIEITRAAARLRLAEGIGRFDEDADASQIMAIPSSISGDRPCLIVCGSPEEERNRIVKEVKYLAGRLLFQPNQICCLARSSQTRSDLLKAFQVAGIKAHDYRADEAETSADSVLVSTLHNSKGHEFRAVFILGATEGLIPFTNSQEPEELEKEAALLYVAMTRAKELLYLSYPTKNMNGKPYTPSRFLSDLGDSVDILNFVN